MRANDESNEIQMQTQNTETLTQQNEHNNNATVINLVQPLSDNKPTYAGSYAGSYAPSYAQSVASVQEQKEIERDIKRQQEDEEKEKADVLKRKNPLCSIPWTIADNRYAMIVLQLVVLGISGGALYLIFSQSSWIASSNTCPDESFGPFIALDTNNNNKIIECSWPQMNSILHTIPGIIGAISSIITLIVSLSFGPKVAKAVDAISSAITVTAEEKIEYFDIYNGILFRTMRKIVGWCGYLQFVGFGIDLHSYLIGQKYAISVQNYSSTGNPTFHYLLIVTFFTAVFLRLSHDSMWQREYKWVLYAQQEIQGATVKGGIQNVDAVISGGNGQSYHDGHHIDPSRTQV